MSLNFQLCVYSMYVCAHRVLEAKEHQLYLVDEGGVEVQVQLELGDGGRHDAPLRGMDEVSKDADDLLDVCDGQLELFTALHIHIHIHIHTNIYIQKSN